MNTHSRLIVTVSSYCALAFTMVLCGSTNAVLGSVQQAQYPVQIDVLIQPQPSFQLFTQDWGRVLQQMQKRATFRTGRQGEKTRIENQVFRDRSSVLAVGIMNRDGTISFRNQTFNLNQPEPLLEWIEQLELYGADGPPNQNATWGLDEDQFRDVLKKLSTVVTEPVSLRSPIEAIDSLKLPEALPVTYTEAARKRAAQMSGKSASLSDQYIGISKGSALAAALAQFGLGFRPKHSAAGLVLEVDTGTESDNLYPVGWKNTAPITTVLPALIKSVPVDLQDAKLDALIQLIAQKLVLKYFYSSYALALDGKDVTKIKYSRKPDKLSMFHLMDIVGKTHDMGLSLRTDEAGNLFLWVTTQAEDKAYQKRFAHVKVAP